MINKKTKAENFPDPEEEYTSKRQRKPSIPFKGTKNLDIYHSFVLQPEHFDILQQQIEVGGKIVFRFLSEEKYQQLKKKNKWTPRAYLDFISKEEVDRFRESVSTKKETDSDRI